MRDLLETCSMSASEGNYSSHRSQITRKVFPVAVMFSLSIALSNGAALRLTVPFMQMLKVSVECVAGVVRLCA